MGGTTGDGGSANYNSTNSNRSGFTPQSREELRILVALYEILRFDHSISAKLIDNTIEVWGGSRLYVNRENLVVSLRTGSYRLFDLHSPDCFEKVIEHVTDAMGVAIVTGRP